VSALAPGSELETVLLGGFCGGVFRIWRADGVSEDHQVDQAEPIVSALAQGFLARTSTGVERFREVALFDAQSGLLLLMARPRLQAGRDGAESESVTVQTRPVPSPGSADPTAWMEWGRWLSAIVLAAAGRGEYVVVEQGGWDVVDAPYVLLGVFSDEAGARTSVVEALPAPAEAPWSGPADDTGGASLVAPATEENVDVAGLLATPAVELWAASPLDVVLTFGVNPEGPWQP
jgi:hypothetical protein